MELKVIRDTESFLELEADWRRIHAEAPDVSIFSGWDWLSLWWEQYGGGRDLCVLVAWVDGGVVGILPMYLERSRLFRVLPIRRLCMVGVGGDTSPDYLGPIVLGPHRDEAHVKFARWLAESDEWHMVYLRDLLGENRFAEAMQTTCKLLGRKAVVGVSARIAVVSLARTWEEYLAAFNKDTRYRMTVDLKRAEKNGNVRFYWWQDLATLDQAIDKLIELHRKRWHGRGTGHSFSSDRYIAFHRALMKRLAARGELSLQCLEYNGELVAIDYNYFFRGSLYAFQGGFDPQYADIRPGKVLTAMSLRDAANRGLKYYDFLKGEYQAKLLWTQNTRETEYIRVFGRDWRGRLAWLRHGVLPRLKRMFKNPASI